MHALVLIGGALMSSLASGNSAAVKHPVYPATASAASYERRTAKLMQMSERDMVELVPATNGFRFCGCPNCQGGTEESQIAWNGPDDPDHVHCRYCKMVYPNAKYPMNQIIEAANRRGEKGIWRYYLDEKKNQYFFLGRARYDAKDYMAKRAYDFAAAYALTKNQKYARRAALLLCRYAEVYPKWNVMYDYPAPGKKYPVVNAKPPYPYWGGIWSRWWYADVPVDLIHAYDLIYDSGEIEKIAKDKGVGLRTQLEDEVFRAAVAFVRTYKEPYSNMSPLMYRGLIVAGRVLGEPDYVHDAVERIKTLYRTQFFFDGLWHEGTTSYHYQTTNSLASCLNVVKGYSDPPAYAWPKDDSRFDKLDLAKDIPIIARAKIAPQLLVFPNGKAVALHDTWSRDRRRSSYREGPALLSDYGHGRLSFGAGQQAMQAHLHFSGGFGHQHCDNLSTILFAKGQELLSDIGYSWTAWRFWVSHTPSHNTVAVNGQLHNARGHGGDLQLYSGLEGPVQAIEASQPGSYPGVTNEFRRRLILIKVSEANAYVVDVFRVQGGEQHEYFLHGSADHPQTAVVSLGLKPTPGTLLGPDADFELPKLNTERGKAPRGKLLAYALFRNLRETHTDGPLHVTWRFDKETDAQLRTTFVGQRSCRVILAHTPQIRPAKETDGNLPKHWRPSLVIQRKGGDGLASTFVAVHEPFLRQPFIRSVRPLLPVDQGQPDNPIALAIEHNAGTDYVVSCKQMGGMPVNVGGPLALKCQARIAVVRMKNGQVENAYLCDGEALSLGDFSMKCQGSLTGQIESVVRDERKAEYSFLVTGHVPEGEALKDHTIIVTHADKTTHGYLIKSVEVQDGKSLVHLQNEPGFDYVGGITRFLFYPQHNVTGGNTYRIDRAVILSK